MSDDKAKILVDDDWKAAAQREKVQLSEQLDQKQSAAGRSGMPKADYTALLNMLAMQAAQVLGVMPDQSGRAYVDPLSGRLLIDLIAVLQEKTKGNLTEQEDKDTKRTLQELRMVFVELMQELSRQSASGNKDPNLASMLRTMSEYAGATGGGAGAAAAGAGPGVAGGGVGAGAKPSIILE